MLHRITIDEVVEKGDGYDRHREVYQQVVPNLDLQAVIAVVNGLERYAPSLSRSELCLCGHSRIQHWMGVSRCEKCTCPCFDLDAVVDPNPLDHVSYKDGE